MRRIAAFVAWASLAWAADEVKPVAVRCGQLLDVRSGQLRADMMVLTDDEKIVSVEPAASAKLPADAVVVALPKQVCLPGLIDVHVHLTGDPSLSGYRALGFSQARQAIRGVRNAKRTLMAGFTTVRNVGAAGFTDVALREAIENREVEGPRLQVSGPSLGITGGHCDNNLLAYEYKNKSEGVADGPWEIRAKVRENVKYGADLIKFCASGGVLSKGDLPQTPQYTLEEMKALVEEAHKLGRRVAAHAHGAQSIKEAILAGVDSVEHCSFIDEEGIRLAKERGTWLVFDVYNDDFILAEGAKMGMLPESIEKERMVGRTQRENFRKAFLAGTKMAFGTDGGVYPHGDNWRQFPHMVEWGMKPVDALRAATLQAAELMGLAKTVGSVETGFAADLIAIDGNPLEDVRNLKNVRFVMKDGTIYRNDVK
jgi:imidazolonepropionase-like amidohydrolase